MTQKFFYHTIMAMLLWISNQAWAKIDTPAMPELGVAVLPVGAVDLTTTPMAGVPVPQYQIGELVMIPTILIAKTTTDDGGWIDSTLIDDFIEDISPNARHYPPNFPNRTTEYHVANHLTYLLTWLAPFANDPNASFDVLLRAAKLAIMGRNMGMSEYALPAATYLDRMLKLQPDHVEANFLYGMMLSEGGGFKEGKVYLDKAASLGYLEAEQSLIQAMLISGDGDKQTALSALQALQARYPDNIQLAKQMQMVEAGGYYIWNIADNQLRIKPLPEGIK